MMELKDTKFWRKNLPRMQFKKQIHGEKSSYDGIKGKKS